MLPSSENQSWENQLLGSQLINQGINNDEMRVGKRLGIFEGFLHSLGRTRFFAFFGLGKYQWVPVGKKDNQFVYVKIETLTTKLGLTEADIRQSLGERQKAKEKTTDRQNKVDLLSKKFLSNEVSKAIENDDMSKLQTLQAFAGEDKEIDARVKEFFKSKDPLFHAFFSKEYTKLVGIYKSHAPTKETLEKVLPRLIAANADPASILLLQRIISQADAISSFPFNKHKLTPVEILHVATVGELALQDPTRKAEAIYLRRGVDGLPRALLIDYQKKSFVILSKKMGQLQKQGAAKKVTDAVEVASIGAQKASTQHFARLVNKQGTQLSPEEIALERRYGDVHLIVTYVGKKGFEKTTIIQVPYDGSLEDYIELGGNPAKKRLTLPERLQIFQQIGQKVAKMHQDGSVHNDLKLENVLIRKNPDGSHTIKVADFGLTYNPSEGAFNPLMGTSYGTSSYTSPEVIAKKGKLTDETKQGQAEDSFALGCLMYELLHPTESLPWWKECYKFFKHKVTADVAITAFDKGLEEIHAEIKALPAGSKQREILTLCLGLLNKDPAKRMTVATFNSKMAALLA